MSRHIVDARLSLEIPDDWEVWEATDDVLFVAAAPEMGRDDLQPHFFVIRNAATHESSQDYLVSNVIWLQNCQEGYVEHGTEVFDLDGLQIGSVTFDSPAFEWVFTNKQYYLVVDGWAYLITCKMLPEQAARWLHAFDRIVNTLRVSDAK